MIADNREFSRGDHYLAGQLDGKDLHLDFQRSRRESSFLYAQIMKFASDRVKADFLCLRSPGPFAIQSSEAIRSSS
jgi:hypothetical protein